MEQTKVPDLFSTVTPTSSVSSRTSDGCGSRVATSSGSTPMSVSVSYIGTSTSPAGVVDDATCSSSP